MNVSAKKTNQEKERCSFEKFRKVYKLPQGVVCYGDKPDVIVSGDCTIGIELTSFYREPGSEERSEQRQRQWRFEVVSKAHRRYLAAGGKNIELTITFDVNNIITSDRKKVLPRKIAELAARIDMRPMGAFYGDCLDDMPEVLLIWSSGKEWPNPVWNRPGQVHIYQEMSVARLKQIIAEAPRQSALRIHHTQVIARRQQNLPPALYCGDCWRPCFASFRPPHHQAIMAYFPTKAESVAIGLCSLAVFFAPSQRLTESTRKYLPSAMTAHSRPIHCSGKT
jgi:hypothetical protein